MLKFYKFDVKPPHPKTPADWQTSAGKFGTNGEILEIWGKFLVSNQQRAIIGQYRGKNYRQIASRGYTCGKNFSPAAALAGLFSLK